MVTEKDIMNMGRKIKRSNNPKTLARTQADILTLEEKIKLEEEAREHRGARTDLSDPKSPMLESKKIAVKIAEQMIPLEEKIKLEEEARAAEYAGRPKKEPGLPGIPGSNESKKVAVKIAEKAGVSPATVYRVHAVHKNGAPEVKELMSKGELSAKAADDFVRIVPSKEEQTKIVENGGVEAIKQTVSQKVEHALELLSEKPAWEEESTEEGKRNQAMFWNYNNWLVIRGMLDKLFCPNCGCTDLKLQCCGMSIEDAAKIAHDKTQAAIDETNAKRKVIADE